MSLSRSGTQSAGAPELAAAVLSGDRTATGRAITLVESSASSDRHHAQQLLAGLLPHSGGAHRVGITGVPGSGKSTLIDTLGSKLTAAGHRVGVLAVDPTSTVSGGSILGDKTRMPRLAVDENAFVRPSPTAGMLGGVTDTTPQVITVLEAAGCDIVLVETVGVGQSETAVHASVDCLCVLLLAGAGDELQSIKRGLLEVADVLVVNKADGDRKNASRLAAQQTRAMLHLRANPNAPWTPPVLTLSALNRTGVDELWDTISEHRQTLTGTGELVRRRGRGRLAWMQVLLERRLLEQVESRPGFAAKRAQLEAAVERGDVTPDLAVSRLLADL